MFRSVAQDAYARLGRFVPAIVSIVAQESPQKDVAVTLLLEYVTNHSPNSAIVRRQLAESGAIERVFLLLETHPRKGNVMAALEQWCSSEPNVVQAAVLARRSAFVDVIATTLDAEAVDVQIAVAKSGTVSAGKVRREVVDHVPLF
jgi:hypothetical protein